MEQGDAVEADPWAAAMGQQDARVGMGADGAQRPAARPQDTVDTVGGHRPAGLSCSQALQAHWDCILTPKVSRITVAAVSIRVVPSPLVCSPGTILAGAEPQARCCRGWKCCSVLSAIGTSAALAPELLLRADPGSHSPSAPSHPTQHWLAHLPALHFGVS